MTALIWILGMGNYLIIIIMKFTDNNQYYVIFISQESQLAMHGSIIRIINSVLNKIIISIHLMCCAGFLIAEI